MRCGADPHDVRVVVGVEEVDVVGQPADTEHGDDHHEHLDHLPLVLPALDGGLCQLPGSVSPQILSWRTTNSFTLLYESLQYTKCLAATNNQQKNLYNI